MMKIITISKIIDELYFYNISEEEKENIKLYAPHYINQDEIGKGYVKRCLNLQRLDSSLEIIITLFIIWYFLMLIIYPIFYSYIIQIDFLNSLRIISFGLTDFLHSIKWYWAILINIAFIAIIIIFYFILESIFGISNLYSEKNKLKEYILALSNKGLISSETIKDKILNINKKVVIKDKNMNNEVFIVHGHDSSAKFEVARFIEKIGLKAIILHEQINKGKTIIEKIENYTDVIFSVVLLTPDDIMKNNCYRARQNVIFELGYLMSKLGRHRICALIKGDVEVPTDISGVIYIKYDTDGAWKIKVAKEMKSVGINVDLNELY